MITGPRRFLIGGHVTKEVKQKLQDEARKQNVSVSQLLYQLLKQTLKVKEAA